MKKSDLKNYIKENIKSILAAEASKEEVENQKELNKELEKTVNLSKQMGLKEEDDEDKGNTPYNVGDKLLVNMGDDTEEELTVSRVFYFNPPKGKKEYGFRAQEYDKGGMVFLNSMVKQKLNENDDVEVEDDWYKSNDEDGDKDKEPSKSDLKKDAKATKGVAKAKDELAILTREMKSLARKYKEATGAEKDKIVADLKAKTKLKKELEAILDK